MSVAGSFHVDGVRAGDLLPIIRQPQQRGEADDGRGQLLQADIENIASHQTVNHSKDEYVRYEDEEMISTNTVAGYYSIWRKFDFRYSNRSVLAICPGWCDASCAGGRSSSINLSLNLNL